MLMVLVLSELDVSSVLAMPEGVRVIEDVFRQHAAGETTLVPRLNVNLPESAGAFRAMAAVLPCFGMFGLKTLTGYPGRRAPQETYFAILLFDGRDGALLSIMAASHITGIRTGAASGVAAKYLSREGASVVGIFGAGIQARYQIDALAAVRPVKAIKVFDIDTEKAAAFARALEADLKIATWPATTAKEAVGGSDLVVAATTAREPVFQGEWLDEGVHVCGVGANSPAKRELDEMTFRRSNKVVVDFKEQVLEEAGDLQAAIRNGAIAASGIYAELGDIIVGRKAGRQSASEITMFKSVGVAIEDIAVAAFVYEQAVAKGLGTPIALDGNSALVASASVPNLGSV
jgi:alanine dehydrogenase